MVAGSRCIQVAEKAWLERGKQEPVKDHSCAKITKCPKLLSEGIPNTNEFTKDSSVDVCKCCGYYVYCAYCAALKVIEYDHETSMMTILYQGEHNCRPKPNRRKKFDEIRDLTKNDTSI